MTKKLMESQFSPKDKTWLIQRMKNLGFEFHGDGWDKMVWINDDNEIALVVGPLNDARSNVFTNWIRFCADNHSNKFLPDISEPREVKNPSTGTEVLIAKSERLFEMDSISENVATALSFLASEVEEFYAKKQDFLTAVESFLTNPSALEETNSELLRRKGRIFFSQRAHRVASGLEYLILHLGLEDIKHLASTIFDVVQEGRKLGLNIDLHGGNFMIASDGDIVINDPWVQYGQSSSQNY